MDGYRLKSAKGRDTWKAQESSKLRVSSCLLPDSWTVLTALGNSVWQIIQSIASQGRSLSPSVQSFFWSSVTQTSQLPTCLTSVSSPSKGQLTARYPCPYYKSSLHCWYGPGPPGKQRHFYQAGHSKDLEVTSQVRVSVFFKLIFYLLVFSLSISP